MPQESCSRRQFLRWSALLAAGAPVSLSSMPQALLAAEAVSASSPGQPSGRRSDTQVAIVSCRGYGPEVKAALKQCFDLLGGIGGLVRNKTVTVKLNLTSTNFTAFFGRPVGESFMTHFSTALALGSQLVEAGARRVRFVESTQSKAGLETSLDLADWDVKALQALGNVEFENTRNLGKGKRYAQLKVPDGGRLFASFQFNRAYEETDVMVSLCKLKQHLTTGVTLSMKNLFGITPNSLYGDEAGSEDATGGRGPLHGAGEQSASGTITDLQLPGIKKHNIPNDPSYRVPRIITDICAARPIHLAIIDGITAMSGGEGPWCGEAGALKLTRPGVIIAGFNPVSADAVGTAVMGYANPRAGRGTDPFRTCDNHLRLAEQAGLGLADPAQIDVRGLPIEKARYRYEPLKGA